MADYKQNETYYIHCFDCDSIRRQKYKGETSENLLFFLCEECGCENRVPKDEC